MKVTLCLGCHSQPEGEKQLTKKKTGYKSKNIRINLQNDLEYCLRKFCEDSSRPCAPGMKHRLFNSKNFRKVTHCLFDLDGTVLDSEIMYHNMIQNICEKYGRTYTKELEVRMYGETDREISLTVVKELKLPISADEFELQLAVLAQKMLPSAPLQKGAERLLKHLHDYKIPMALATNSTEQAVRLHANARPILFGLFHHKVSATDPEVDRGKPNPDIYLVAASRFPDKPKPKQCLVFEDSVIGVEAAKEAGMQVVMIPDPTLDRERTRHATMVIRTLLDFKPELFGLPPFDDAASKGKRKSQLEPMEA